MRSWLLLLPALPVLAADPTWREVQPILERRCVQCHQKGEVAPMAFTSYQEARPFSKAIRQAVAVTQTMPPWHAAKGSHAFRNDRSLSAAEIKTLTAWADTGARDGQPASPSAAAASTANAPSQWKLGRPDRTVKVPGFQVPASGQLNYSFLIVPLDLKEDTWIRAAEFRIDQRGAVHHINAFVRPPGSSYLAE
ncbi:MAG: thiol-disulfide isomerase, partial [Acidobacteria bacterium]|nr:thiol-disulfide isomerase [Acidobacteriota bacterium]